MVLTSPIKKMLISVFKINSKQLCKVSNIWQVKLFSTSVTDFGIRRDTSVPNSAKVAYVSKNVSWILVIMSQKYIFLSSPPQLSSVARQDIWLQLLREDSSFLVQKTPTHPGVFLCNFSHKSWESRHSISLNMLWST